MKVLCVIPARMGSTRIPRKPLALIAGKPMVQRTWQVANACDAVDKVLVATDDQAIAEVVSACGGEAILTPANLQTGSDRVAYVAEQYPEYDIVINLQGDEPFMKASMLQALIAPFIEEQTVQMTTLGSPLDRDKDHANPNIVKVIFGINGDALYFSRAPIPYFRQPSEQAKVLHHKGIYGFRREFLLQYTQLPQTPLEIAESLEQLRALEHGFAIRVCEVAERTLEINTPEELAEAQSLF